MKIYAYSILIAATCLMTNCKSSIKVDIEKPDETTTSEMTYDSTLAVIYGADEYGMKQFVIAFLKKVATRNPIQPGKLKCSAHISIISSA